jgi:predicted ester cyclase
MTGIHRKSFRRSKNLAFPVLELSVTLIHRLEVHIECDGAHDGPFFDFMLATGRHVRFAERHMLQISGDRVVVDKVTIDLRAIIRQLAHGPRHVMIPISSGQSGPSTS